MVLDIPQGIFAMKLLLMNAKLTMVQQRTTDGQTGASGIGINYSDAQREKGWHNDEGDCTTRLIWKAKPTDITLLGNSGGAWSRDRTIWDCCNVCEVYGMPVGNVGEGRLCAATWMGVERILCSEAHAKRHNMPFSTAHAQAANFNGWIDAKRWTICSQQRCLFLFTAAHCNETETKFVPHFIMQISVIFEFSELLAVLYPEFDAVILYAIVSLLLMIANYWFHAIANTNLLSSPSVPCVIIININHDQIAATSQIHCGLLLKFFWRIWRLFPLTVILGVKALSLLKWRDFW